MDLSRLIARHAQFQPERTALSCAGEQLSYAALWQRIEAATRGLAGLGLRRGDRVAYLGFNHPEMMVLLFALARLGGVLVPLNWRLAEPELQAILEHAAVTTLFAGTHWLTHGRALCDRLPGVTLVPFDDGTAAPAAGARQPAVERTWTELCGDAARPGEAGCDDDPVLLVYTSGTTGRPKGVLHLQSGLLWNAVNAIDYQEIGRGDHVLSVLPMFHVGGLCIQTLPALHAGARVTLHPRFDAGRWLQDTAALRPTLSLLVPATLRAVIDHPAWARTDLSSLRMLNTGSSTVPESLITAFLDRGVATTQVYGATETGPVSIYLKVEDAYRRVGSAGKPGLHVDVRRVAAGGRDAAPDEAGEIWVRGPAVMKGYWRDDANPAFEQGWFKSGDLATVDAEGFYRVVGRSKDMIISGGENIYPAELEHILAECPDIVEAAVVGQDDARWGEVAVAVILRRTGSALDEAAVLRMFEGRLARFKHPRRVLFMDALPRNALGKVQKAELRQLLSAGED